MDETNANQFPLEDDKVKTPTTEQADSCGTVRGRVERSGKTETGQGHCLSRRSGLPSLQFILHNPSVVCSGGRSRVSISVQKVGAELG